VVIQSGFTFKEPKGGEKKKMAKRHKKKGMKVGQSKICYRKVGGKRRRVKVTKKSKKKYIVKVIGKKKRK